MTMTDRPTRSLAPALLALALLCLPLLATAQLDPYGGADYEKRRAIRDLSQDLIYRLHFAMVEGRNCADGLQAWFEADKLKTSGKLDEAIAAYRAGLAAMPADLPMLPQATYPKPPTAEAVGLELLDEVPVETAGVTCRIARWKTGKLTQYGVILYPSAAGEYPLLVYLHGAAFGVPTYSMPFLAEHAAMGYVVAAPALRGEPLFAGSAPLEIDADAYTSEGQIENLLGEPDDALAMAIGAQSLAMTRGGKFAVMGHSFGSGAGLLLPTRTDQVACIVSYDAWLTNPFRYYWDRLAGGANNWQSWEYYTEQPVADQLSGLMARSIVHHADRIDTPMLLFMGGAYNGSVFHKSHQDFITALRAADKTNFRYEVIPGGGHNFVLYPDDEPAQIARAMHVKFLQAHFPPTPPKATPAPAAP